MSCVQKQEIQGLQEGRCRIFLSGLQNGLQVENFDVPSCYKCGHLLDDYSKAVLMGSGKARHIRCRKTEKKKMIKKREGGIKTC